MPLSNQTNTGSRQQLSDQSNQQQQQMDVKLVYATKQNNSDEPIEMAFAVKDPTTGTEKIVKAENIYGQDLFELTQEGQYWLNNHSQPVIRTVAQRGQKAA